jgi:2-polyprenyl-6-methoxyphenol hydroxylase-like FAD-dependent oxidoreductase
MFITSIMVDSDLIRNVAVVGAGIGGLMSALALNRHSIKVTLFERDAAPTEGVLPENSLDWLRKGVPQSLHPHFFMGRLRVLLEEHYPDLVTQLVAAGADQSRLGDYVHPKFAHQIKFREDDDQLKTFNCRRTTFEMIVRQYTKSLPSIVIHSDTKVIGLTTDSGNPVSVTGLQVAGDNGPQSLQFDAVIDASGRFSKLAKLLESSGVRLQEDQRDSGIWYLTRHYRLKPGQTYPQVFGLPGAQFEDFIVGALPGDNDYFTVTFQVYREDKLLTAALRDPDHFQYVCAATNQVAPWVDPARAEPTSKVYGFGQMDSYWRKTVIDDQPRVLNYFCVGDSCLRSNPKYGRGCTWSTLSAHDLSDLLASKLTPTERIRCYEKTLDEKFYKDWLTMRNIDRSTERAFEVAVGKRLPTVAERVSQRVQNFVNEAIVLEPALFRDLWRGYNGFQNMDEWSRNPQNWLRLIRAWFKRSDNHELLSSQRGRLSHQEMSERTAQ